MCGQSTAPLDILNIPILLGTNMKPAAQNTDVADQIMLDSLSVNAGLSEPALLVRNLHKTYNGGAVKVFSDVSFDIRPGESVALIGANGTGKSTLLRSCVGLMPVEHGEVLHGALAWGVGLRAWSHMLAPEHERQKAIFCLQQVGLADLADRRAGNLSGGQSQRVAIARALMQDPGFLFADEPVASLDPVAGKDIMDLFHRLNVEQNITFVFVSHQVEHALKYANRILGLRAGRLELDIPSAAQTPQMLRELYV
jgi:phosphonate transport system ATP-binding protein